MHCTIKTMECNLVPQPLESGECEQWGMCQVRILWLHLEYLSIFFLSQQEIGPRPATVSNSISQSVVIGWVRRHYFPSIFSHPLGYLVVQYAMYHEWNKAVGLSHYSCVTPPYFPGQAVGRTARFATLSLICGRKVWNIIKSVCWPYTSRFT